MKLGQIEKGKSHNELQILYKIVKYIKALIMKSHLGSQSKREWAHSLLVRVNHVCATHIETAETRIQKLHSKKQINTTREALQCDN